MTADTQLERRLMDLFAAEEAVHTPAYIHPAAMARVRRARQRAALAVRLRNMHLPAASHSVGQTRILLLVGAALLLAALVGAFVAGGPSPAPGSGGWITYGLLGPPGSARDEVWSVRWDGTNDHLVGSGDCQSTSVDGTSMVLWSTRADPGEDVIFAGTRDGAEPHAIAGVATRAAAISPDGAKVAWVKELRAITSLGGQGGVGSVGELWLSAVGGSPGVRLVPPAATPNVSFAFPTWSPLGDRIAFVETAVTFSGDLPVYESWIWVVRADGSDLRRLVRAEDSSAVSWSPDGRWLAYISVSQRRPALLVVATAGASSAAAVDLAQDLPWAQDPRWSPDGAYIAVRTDGGIATVKVSDGRAVGSPNLLPATVPGAPFDVGPWAPDGQRLLLIEGTVPPEDGGPAEFASRLLTIDPQLHDAPSVLLAREGMILASYPMCPVSWRGP